MTRLLKRGGEARVSGNYMPYIPAARAVRNAVQSIPNVAGTFVAFDGEDLDTDNIHDLVTNPGRLTCRTAGLYLVTAKSNWSANPASGYIAFFLNGGEAYRAEFGGNEWSNGATYVFNLAVGDYLEMRVYQSSGGAINVTGAMSMTYFGPGLNAVREKPVVSYVTPAQFAALVPVDGDEVYMVVDAAAGVTWHLRYNAGSASAYKWEFLGGSPLVSEVLASETTLSAAYTVLATAGPSIALPRAGDYDVQQGVLIQPTGNTQGFMSYDIGGVAATDTDSILVAPSSTEASVWRTRRKTALTAVSLVSKYRSNGTINVGFARRALIVTPVRIS